MKIENDYKTTKLNDNEIKIIVSLVMEEYATSCLKILSTRENGETDGELEDYSKQLKELVNTLHYLTGVNV